MSYDSSSSYGNYDWNALMSQHDTYSTINPTHQESMKNAFNESKEAQTPSYLLLISGYIRNIVQSVDINYIIPSIIILICSTFFEKFDNPPFTIFNDKLGIRQLIGNTIQVLKPILYNDNKQKLITFISSNSWIEGIYKIKFQFINNSNISFEGKIGIISNINTVKNKNNSLSEMLTSSSCSYFWDRKTQTVFGYEYGNLSTFKPVLETWDNGDYISIVCDCEQNAIQFLKNYHQLIHEFKIKKNEKYHAFCAFNGGHYMLTFW